MKRYCLALDLIDDPELITQYKVYHQKVWPEIIESIKEAGITSLVIYSVSNRLFMIMRVKEGFSFEKKTRLDEMNPYVKKWEDLMWNYQQALPIAKKGEKWVLMEEIFSLENC